MVKITVDQRKVLKNRLYRLFRFYWATRYNEMCVLFTYPQILWTGVACRYTLSIVSFLHIAIWTYSRTVS